MIPPELLARLEPVARRHRRLQLRRELALCYGIAAIAGLGLIGLHGLTGFWSTALVRLLGAAAFAAAIFVWWRWRQQPVDWHWVAGEIEARHPELNTLLLAALEQQPQPDGSFNFLQQRVVSQALEHSRKKRWTDGVPGGQLVRAQAVHLGTLACLLLVVFGLRSSAEKAAVQKAIEAVGVQITPGDASLEKGQSLIIFARFAGPLPAGVDLVLAGTPDGGRTQPLVKSLDDPVFGGSVSEAQSDFTYRIEYSGQRSRDFKVKVFEHPKLERADADLAYPAYTGLPARRIENTRRLTAVEGTKVQLAFQFNKPVARAQLVARDQSAIPLDIVTNRPAALLKDFAIEESKTYDLQLVDADGRTNKVPAHFVFEALKNRQPELKLTAPRGDQRVSAIEEITFSGEAWDDFGLRAYGLGFMIGGGDAQFMQLGDDARPGEKRPFSHVLPLEPMRLAPDELIAYFIWADDTGPDGEVRRTASDMYFAEVRPFEEIFREAAGGDQDQQPQQQQQGQPQGGQGERLAELQKQIISATWKLQRQAAGIKAPAAKGKSSFE
ncbi:MAG: hypothetical protein FJ386_06585 [Verrucomicrobia bacterium]|nr:hypothetical protein [Verrucomicrobiota bacterium]